MDTTEIILITHADTEKGCVIARVLLAAGHRVAVTARHPASLSRILLGQSADRVIAIAGDIDDSNQLDGILRRALTRFDAPVTRIIDGRYAGFPKPSRSRSHRNLTMSPPGVPRFVDLSPVTAPSISISRLIPIADCRHPSSVTRTWCASPKLPLPILQGVRAATP